MKKPLDAISHYNKAKEIAPVTYNFAREVKTLDSMIQAVPQVEDRDAHWKAIDEKHQKLTNVFKLGMCEITHPDYFLHVSGYYLPHKPGPDYLGARACFEIIIDQPQQRETAPTNLSHAKPESMIPNAMLSKAECCKQMGDQVAADLTMRKYDLLYKVSDLAEASFDVLSELYGLPAYS